MASTFSLTFTGADGETPTTTDSKQSVRNLINWLRARLGGNHFGTDTVKVRTSGVYASAIVTAAAVQSGDTVTINGTALTATQHNATGTVTMTVSGIDVDDTVTVNGYAFTAKASETLASGYFNIGGTDAQAATSLAACINASTDPLISGIVTASASSAVCTIRAVTAGTGGNSITLASSDAQAAVSASTLTNGATVANNQFDYVGTNTQTGTALAAAINASTTALVNKHVTAAASSGAVTVTATYPGHAGNAVTLATSNGTRLAITGSVSRLTGGTETLTTFTF